MPTTMLKTAVVLLLESSLNKLLATDSVTLLSLAKLSGKVIEFKISDAPIHFYLFPHPCGVELQQQFLGDSDTLLQGPLTSFTALLSSEDSSAQFFGNGISISGDTKLAAKFQRIIAEADIDWQGLVANLSGDLVAAQLAKVVNSTRAQLSITTESLELNIAEYLQEETRTLPAGPEVEGFIDDVDNIRSAVDRLDARFTLLTAQVSTQSKT